MPGKVGRGEAGLPGVKVFLKDQAGKKVATATAAANGTFTFTDLAPGTYRAGIDAATFRKPFGGVTWLGSGLVLVALLHGLLRNDVLLGWLEQASVSLHHPWVVAALLHATWMSAAVVWLGRRTTNPVSTKDSDPLVASYAQIRLAGRASR